jgi:hypothetical protein
MRSLELEVSSWADIEEKAEVNVDDVALIVNEKIAVVTVFDLEYKMT